MSSPLGSRRRCAAFGTVLRFVKACGQRLDDQCLLSDITVRRVGVMEDAQRLPGDPLDGGVLSVGRSAAALQSIPRLGRGPDAWPVDTSL